MPDARARHINTIIVGVDGSDSSIAALRWACDLASSTEGTIDAVAVWHLPMSLGAPIPIPADYDPAGDAQNMLDQIVEPLVAAYPSVTIRAAVVEGHATEALVEASLHGDLLVVGNRGHGELTGLLLGSVSQHCAAHAACPVVVYRQRPPAD